VESQLEVQVGSSARARAAGRSDPLAGLDHLTDPDTPAGEVGVERRVAVADRDLDDVAVALVPVVLADGDHAAALGRPHGKRAEDADVNARVPPPGVIAERRGHRPGGGPG
jgi:hypothetical protein